MTDLRRVHSSRTSLLTRGISGSLKERYPGLDTHRREFCTLGGSNAKESRQALRFGVCSTCCFIRRRGTVRKKSLSSDGSPGSVPHVGREVRNRARSQCCTRLHF